MVPALIVEYHDFWGRPCMPGPILYSTNPHYAFEVCRRYRGGRSYAWCSESFSSVSVGSGVAASSDPQSIYEQLFHAVHSEDRHDPRIKGYKRNFRRLADIWLDKGEITTDQSDEIHAACKQHSWLMWRPTLYIIPRAPIEAAVRLTLVPVNKRAGRGNEYIIADLRPEEFDIVELPRLRG